MQSNDFKEKYRDRGKKNLTSCLSKISIGGVSRPGGAVTELLAHDIGLELVPLVVANVPPSVLVEDLDVTCGIKHAKQTDVI